MFRKSFIFLFSLSFFFIMGVFIFNFLVKKKYEYNLDYYTAIPNKVEIYQNEDQKITGEKITIINDELGFRNNIKISEAKILFLGDSFIRALNTNDKNLLSKSFNSKIYNGGMDGFSTYNSIETAKFLLKKNKFEKIFLFFTMNNDFRDNLYQKRYQNNITDKLIIFLKNNSFFNELLKLKKFFYYNKMKSNPNNIYEIDKPYHSINLLKLFIDDNEYHNKVSKLTIDAFSELKELSDRYDAELVIVGIPTLAEITKDFRKIKNLQKDLELENLEEKKFNLNIDYKRPQKIFMSVCDEIEINCYYINNLDKNSYFKIDDHWNSHGQKKAKEFIIKKNLIN